MPALKVFLGRWLLPLPICLLLVCAGLLLRLRGRARSANVLLVLGVACSFIAAFGPVADGLLRPLESRYRAILDASMLDPVPRYVVVLGSGYRPRTGLPVTAALDADALVRLFEGVRLWRQLPGAHLILSGGSIRGEPPIAQGYAIAAAALGVPPEAVILSDQAIDTGAEVRALEEHVGVAPVLLVTSAAHMPRAMALCRQFSVQARAAPTGNLIDPVARATDWLTLPSGAALHKTETAFHEYLGLLALQFGVN
jgi:uncharacterized SAM-binding protein YcdF (DUF218 family)